MPGRDGKQSQGAKWALRMYFRLGEVDHRGGKQGNVIGWPGAGSNPQCRERAYVIYFRTGEVDQKAKKQQNVIGWLRM